MEQIHRAVSPERFLQTGVAEAVHHQGHVAKRVAYWQLHDVGPHPRPGNRILGRQIHFQGTRFFQVGIGVYEDFALGAARKTVALVPYFLNRSPRRVVAYRTGDFRVVFVPKI